MKPILLIHGYSAEGTDNTVAEIYGRLPTDLRAAYGDASVVEIDLSRWISLEDGITIDDVAFALDRALHSDDYRPLLDSGFHVIIHSTGALVVRTWIQNHSPLPSPVANLIHLAGANFGSGLAHIGKGTLARWGRQIFEGNEAGVQVLRELEFGASKTLDLHLDLLLGERRMARDYQVREFCIVGSQIPEMFRLIPVRYVKEDSSDCTVRTAAGNLNFNYLRIGPVDGVAGIDFDEVRTLVEKRLDWQDFDDTHYSVVERSLVTDADRVEIPYAIPYETAHLGASIGIVYGSANREEVMPLIKRALETPEGDDGAYAAVADAFRAHTAETFQRAAELPWKVTEWSPQAQYEGHAQVVFRLRDQHGRQVEHFDLFFNSKPEDGLLPLQSWIEDKHPNSVDKGTTTYYLRLQEFKDGAFTDRLRKVAPLNIEITGHEPETGDILYLPVRFQLSPEQIRELLQPFRTTVVDVTLMRLPSGRVFAIERQP